MLNRPIRTRESIRKCFRRYAVYGDQMTLAEICFWITDTKITCSEVVEQLHAMTCNGELTSVGPFWSMLNEGSQKTETNTISDVVSN